MNYANRIELTIGDISDTVADAIVNAANERLAGGGGVDGAIHRAAGPGLMEECRKIGSCPTGEVRLTGGYNLNVKFVIHAVGPVWKGGHRDEHSLLASCFRESLRLAASKNIRTIAFPAISTGIYGFPVDQAALIAVRETKRFLSGNTIPEKVIFVLFDKKTYNSFLRALDDKEDT